MLEREAEAGPRLAVVVEPVSAGGGIRLDARVENDRAELVRSVLIYVLDDAGRWRSVAPGTIVEASARAYYAEATGPGEAVVASRGSAEAPVSLERGSGSGGGEAWPDPFRDGEPNGGGGDDGPWLWVGVGAGLAVVLGVVIAVILLSGPDGTQPEPPVVLGF
jgi:hypothetical protein